MAEYIEEVPDVISLKVVDSQGNAGSSPTPASITHNDPAEEYDPDSGEELDSGPRENPLWEKRRAQNLIFSDW